MPHLLPRRVPAHPPASGSRLMAFHPASPEKQRAAYEAQQAAMAELEAETTRQMEALVEQYDAAGETEKADFWRDYLAERSGR